MQGGVGVKEPISTERGMGRPGESPSKIRQIGKKDVKLKVDK